MTQQTLDVRITEWWFVALVAIVFAYFVLRRGLTVGLYMLVAIIVGMVLADPIAKFLKPWINFTYQIVLAVMRYRTFTPDELFTVAPKQPELITQNNQMVWLGSIVFVSIVVIGFLIGRVRRARARPPRWTTRILAIMVGLVNGYLVAYFLFPRHVTAQRTVITVPNVNVRDLLRVQLGLPLLIMIVVLITLGVLSARGDGARGK